MKKAQPVKITVNGMADPICPKCNTAMYGVSAMQIGTDKKFQHYARCPGCNYMTEAK
jgi:hypothetical protein